MRIMEMEFAMMDFSLIFQRFVIVAFFIFLIVLLHHLIKLAKIIWEKQEIDLKETIIRANFVDDEANSNTENEIFEYGVEE